MLSIFLIALSLAMDAFAVSVSTGISLPKAKLRHGCLLGAYFGAFQFLMPLIGWRLGRTVSSHVESIGGYIVFALLAVIGVRMVWSAVRGGDNDDEAQPRELLSLKRLLLLAVATSIDALTVGISMSFLSYNILISALVIGVVAFVMSVLGCMLGKKVGTLFQKRAEIVGGAVLILIGVKTLLEAILS